MITATASLPSSTLLRAAAAVGFEVTVRMSLRSLLFRMPTTVWPTADWAAAGATVALAAGARSRFTTATLVAAIENPLPPPPKAKPSRADSASGAASIISERRDVAPRAAQVLERDREDAAHARATPAGRGR